MLIKSVQNAVKIKYLILSLFQKMSVFFDFGIRYYLTLRSLTLYIYGAPILDVSRSHTTTQHSR